MASWLQNQFRKAEELLEAVDRQAKKAQVVGGEIGDAASLSRTEAAVEEQLAALQPASLKLSLSRTPSTSALNTPEEKARAPLQQSRTPAKGPHGAFKHPDQNARQARQQSPDIRRASPQPSTEGIVKLVQSRQGAPDHHLIRNGGSLKPAQAGEEQELVPDKALVDDTAQKVIEESSEGSTSQVKHKAQNGEALSDEGGAQSSIREVLHENGSKLDTAPISTTGINDGESLPPQQEKDEVDGLLSRASSVQAGVAEGALVEESGETTDSVKNPLKIQQDLDEAQSILEQAQTSGQSKEARLSRICEKLALRVQEYKRENEQLEEMLSQSREGQGALDARLKQLEQELSTAQQALQTEEASLQTALAAKNAELEIMVANMEAARRQAAVAEGRLASVQASLDTLTRGRDLTEGRMLQALKEELANAERRLEEEKYDHAQTRKAAAARETELESQMTGGVAALAKMQRQLDERNEKVAGLEHKLSMMEVECATLNHALQEAETKTRRELTRASMQTEDNHSSQVSVWKQEVERARAAQREAEGKVVSQEADMQKMRVELATLRREADFTSVQAQAELEKRFRELTELLYLKQTQLEAMSSEKQAAILQLEKETRRFHEAKAQFEREHKLRSRAVAVADEDGAELAPLDEKIHGSINRIQGIRTAAKYLDFGAISAGRFLWRRPLARLGFLFYLVCLHLFIMHLLHRLQVQAERSSANAAAELAAAAGLVKRGMVIDGRLPG